MKLILEAKVNENGVQFTSHTYARQQLAKFFDKDVFVTIDTKSPKRSESQNNYYWGVVLPLISESTGHSINEMHEIMKRLHLPPKIVRYRGREIKMPNSTATLTKSDFVEYVERIKVEAADLGVNIPSPEEAGYIK